MSNAWVSNAGVSNAWVSNALARLKSARHLPIASLYTGWASQYPYTCTSILKKDSLIRKHLPATLAHFQTVPSVEPGRAHTAVVHQTPQHEYDEWKGLPTSNLSTAHLQENILGEAKGRLTPDDDDGYLPNRFCVINIRRQC